MPDSTYYAAMAHYNQWMNAKLYTAAEQLSPSELIENRGAFFGSILGTLNHLVVADTIWLQRFALHPVQFTALLNINDLPKPNALDDILFYDLPSLSTRRVFLDNVITALIGQLTQEHLTHLLKYQSLKGIPAQKPFYQILWHFFNHQTHHRGQVSTLIMQAGVDIGITDLLMLIPNADD